MARRSATRSLTIQSLLESSGEDTSASDNGAISQEDAIAFIKQVVEEAGEEGTPRRGFPSVLMAKEDEDNAELIKEAAKRATMTAAIKSGAIVEEDGVLLLPE